MSNDKRDEVPDVKAMRQEMAELRQELNQLRAEKNGTPIQANIVMPDVEAARKEKYDRMAEQFDAVQAKAHADLMQGPKHWRICVFDDKCLEAFNNARKNNPKFQPQDLTWPPPQNPWRIVGALDEASAIAKYNKFFGIRSIAGDSQYMTYEVDEHGQPLVQLQAA